MNRIIKFRGRPVANPEQWVYGSLVSVFDRAWIAALQREQSAESLANALGGIHKHVIANLLVEVDPDTVGQHTGLEDKSGNEVYEGDRIRSPQHRPEIMTVAFVEGGFCMVNNPGEADFYPIDIAHFYPSTGCCFTVVGNVHDNPLT